MKDGGYRLLGKGGSDHIWQEGAGSLIDAPHYIDQPPRFYNQQFSPLVGSPKISAIRLSMNLSNTWTDPPLGAEVVSSMPSLKESLATHSR
jgi:hypothetical protein